MIEAMFGIRAETLEEAVSLANQATDLKFDKFDNADYGEYYRYGDFKNERLKILRNLDIYDGGPAYSEAESWMFIALLDRAPIGSKILTALEASSESFIKLTSKSY